MSKSETTIISPSEDVALADALGERYLAYALSTITSRSLPDVRDGLKPVHRRLLYAMLQLKLDPKSGFKKCARVVGDVIGKYHPHGDSAVYDTMVRLAQTFAVRYTLVEGQGNFGSIDGDNAAAMRYTEARLTDVAMELLADIDQNTVDFRPTYDGSEQEPVVLPARFPNLLANGSEGIAVGMATSIPPHNAAEICDGLIHLIDQPDCITADLVEHIKGPDFPTGGEMIEEQRNIVSAYENGKGAFRIRARWHKEELERGQYQIIITEIPYQVQKGRLIEKIADLYRAKKLALLGNIQDESTEDIRIVIEPKNRNVEPEMLMESLFKLTDLESRFNMNLNVLTSAGVPKVLTLKQVLREFLDHRHEVLVRRSNYRLKKIEHRLEILDGFLIAYLNLDEVIRIIREEDEPKIELMKTFELSDVQAEAILNMRLRSLRKLEEMEIKREHKALSKEKKELKALLKDESLRWQRIRDEVLEVKEKFGPETELGKRRTGFAKAPADIDISVEAFVEKEPITVLCSKLGWLRAMKGKHSSLPDAKYKEGDSEGVILPCFTTDTLLVFGSNGKFYTIPANRVPQGRGHGEPLRLMIDLPQDEDIVAMRVLEPEQELMIASSVGKGFRITEKDVTAHTKTGKQILNVPKGSKAALCVPIGKEHDHVAVIGQNRKLLIFPLDQLPEMKKGQGVRLQRYKDGGISDITTFKLEEGLSWQLGERTRTEMDLTAWLGTRAGAGKLPPTGFPRNNKFGAI